MLLGPSFRLAFVFSINSLILSGFSLTSFHLAEVSLSAFSWLYTVECAVIQKYHEMSFIYDYSHFLYSFCHQPALFAQYENVNKPWNNNRIVHGYERSQNQNKTKPRHIQIYHALYCSIQWNKTHKQCNGVIKGWPLKEGFLSIIYWCLAQHDVWSPRKSNFL